MRKLLTLILAACALPACAQIFDVERERVPMSPLSGQMRFHPGDNPRWSEPGFDDSSWPLISPEKSWSEQGYQDLSGFAWYRFEIVVPHNHGQLALYTPGVYTSYQLFADGRLVGSFGGFPPRASVYVLRQRVVLLPPDHGGRMEIAIRVWHWRGWAMSHGGGLTGAPLVGDVGTLNHWAMLQDQKTFWQLSAQNYSALLCFLYCIAGFVLFVMRPKEREYLWYGLLGFCFCASPLAADYASFHDLPVLVANSLAGMLSAAGFFCFVMFVWTLLGRKDTPWIWVSACAAVLEAITLVVFPLFDLQVASVIVFATMLTTTISPMIMLIRGVRRGNPDARLLLIPQALNTLANWIDAALAALVSSGHAWAQPIQAVWSQTFHWPFPFGLYDLSIWIIVLAVLGVVVLRFARSRREEEVLKGEMDAAREVQQVLIPDAIPAVPGFKIESDYRPAGQVGGDFFQILATPQGGILIVIGDVSGKGMPAAMTVSLLVGTFRTLAHYTQSPEQILTAMNQRMLARSRGGFTTCLVLRADRDGKVTAANAGHISPYLHAHEVALENGLPLGLVADSSYREVTFELQPDAQLTILTDGIAEARSASGELFGFERTAAICTRSAKDIASVAQQFGQEDDITVVTLRLVGVDLAQV
jgi:hypothetical protein